MSSPPGKDPVNDRDAGYLRSGQGNKRRYDDSACSAVPKREHEMHVCSARHNGNAALSAQRPYAWEQVQTAMTETCGQSCREFAERLLVLPSLIDSFKALLLQPGILSYI